MIARTPVVVVVVVVVVVDLLKSAQARLVSLGDLSAK